MCNGTCQMRLRKSYQKQMNFIISLALSLEEYVCSTCHEGPHAKLFPIFQDTEILLEQLGKDQEAVDQVREIVEAEENVMKRETQAVQDYADVSHTVIMVFWLLHSLKSWTLRQVWREL